MCAEWEANLPRTYHWICELTGLPGSDRGRTMTCECASTGHEKLDSFRDELLPTWRGSLQNPGDLSRLL